MKKIIISLFLLLIFSSPVFASDNKLYLTENNNKIYYNKDLFNDQAFMYHIEMIPGGSYTDELLIENGTGFNLKLYLKVVEKKQTEEANELLDNITMKMYLDDSLIYDGKVKGLDYNLNGINLQDSILLKEFSSNEKSKIRVELNLSKDYSNKDFNDYSYIDWKFIAQFDKIEPNEPKEEQDDVVVEVVPAPSTGINKKYIPIVIASIGLCTVGCIVIVLTKKKKDENN